MADSTADEQFRTILHIRMDPGVRRRLEAFRKRGYLTRTGAVNLLLNEALDARDAKTGS